ncbi:MAG: hypothetical protein QM235_08365 [Pseudomonadota bacterium]|nr:hypothetical protein [Pseudomonadota bacterium]
MTLAAKHGDYNAVIGQVFFYSVEKLCGIFRSPSSSSRFWDHQQHFALRETVLSSPDSRELLHPEACVNIFTYKLNLVFSKGFIVGGIGFYSSGIVFTP